MLYKIPSLLLLFILQLNLIACNTMPTKTKKYKWVNSVTSPKHFTGKVHRGSLHYGKKEGAPVISSGSLGKGWGSTSTSYGGGDNPRELPHQLDMVWISYRENKFYGGSFKLPKEKMERLFEEGFTHISNKVKENIRDTYHEILIGIAPGGYISVWLTGAGFKTQVAGFYGEETEVEFKYFNPDGIKDREKYVSNRIAGIDSVQRVKPIPFGLWETYAKQYSWKPVVEGAIVDHVFFTENMYFNGNNEIYIHEEANNVPLKARTIPKQISINWARNPDGYRLKSRFNFDEEEVFAVFKELFTDPKTQQAELIFKYNAKKDVDIYLKVGNQQKQLEKVTLGTYKSIH